MIEQYLQVVLELFKEIWFQLNSILGLEETAAFKLIKLYLLELQDTPTYMVIAFVMLTFILLGLYKARSIAREREPKIEKLMEEMDEEEYDEIHVDTQKIMGSDEKEFKLEAISPELVKPNLNKNLNEFQRFDFDSKNTNKEGASYESTINKLNEQLESVQETTFKVKDFDNTDSEDNFYLDKELSTEENFKEPALAKTNELINDPETKKDYFIDDKSGREPESLMSRLKDLQEILDTGIDHGKIGDTSPIVESNIHSAGDPPFLEQQNFAPKALKVTSKDNKKYIEALESFIFLKDQKKH